MDRTMIARMHGRWTHSADAGAGGRAEALFAGNASVMTTSPLDGAVQVETIQVHHFGPRSDEVLDELLLRIGGCIEFGQRTQLRIGTKDQVNPGARPLH